MEKVKWISINKKKIDLNNLKWKIVHPSPSEESHPVTDPLGKTVEETGDSLSLAGFIPLESSSGIPNVSACGANSTLLALNSKEDQDHAPSAPQAEPHPKLPPCDQNITIYPTPFHVWLLNCYSCSNSGNPLHSNNFQYHRWNRTGPTAPFRHPEGTPNAAPVPEPMAHETEPRLKMVKHIFYELCYCNAISNKITMGIIIILSCLTSSDSSKPIQKRTSVSHDGLIVAITYSLNNSSRKEDARTPNEVHF